MKYIIKFKKEGKIRFISHLDLQKVFLRLFRIIGVKPKYSNGFNPHPQLSFALPLSLGFASKAEYLELETEDEKGFDVDEILAKLDEYLPDGLTIVYIRKKPINLNKKLASYIDSTQYKIVCKWPNINDEPCKIIKGYLSQDKIEYEKTSRKSGKTKIIDLKKLIYGLKIDEVNDNNVTLSCTLESGNNSVLSPNILMSNLYEYMGENLDITELSITRICVFCCVNEKILNVDSIFEE